MPSQSGASSHGGARCVAGCGNPTTLAELKVVLDPGSGGGIDALLSAPRVDTTGKGYDLGMTDEVLEPARDKQRTASVPNVERLKENARAFRCGTPRSM